MCPGLEHFERRLGVEYRSAATAQQDVADRTLGHIQESFLLAEAMDLATGATGTLVGEGDRRTRCGAHQAAGPEMEQFHACAQRLARGIAEGRVRRRRVAGGSS
jgi:hypothetical protein